MSDLIRRAYHKALRIKRAIIARARITQAQRSRDILAFQAHSEGGAFAMGPFGRKDVYIFNLRRGVHRIELSHRDYTLKSDRKSLSVSFETSSGERKEPLAKLINVPFSKRIGAFSYLGGGRTRRGVTHQYVDIELPQAMTWLRLRFRHKLDRYINIDRVCVARQLSQVDIDKAVAALLEKIASTPKLRDVEYLLYAEIDPNVVDGSSIWWSSMATMLAGSGKTAILLRRAIESDLVWSNVKNKKNIVLVSPDDLGLVGDLPLEISVPVLEALDDHLGKLRRVIVRGADLAAALHQTRRFAGRSCVYLTDFYTVKDGVPYSTPTQLANASLVTRQAGVMLVQTPAIETQLRTLSPVDFEAAALPPPIPSDLPDWSPQFTEGALRIGYAGKVAPNWGLSELLDWAERLRATGQKVELHIAANKFSDGAGDAQQPGFSAGIKARLRAPGVTHYDDLNREGCIDLLSRMDYVWCYRPAAFEEVTLELSTKLVEMAATGAPCLCYPNDTNQSALGAEYPFFVKSYADFERIMKGGPTPPIESTMRKVRDAHDLEGIRTRLAKTVLGAEDKAKPRVLFSGHDFKFIDAFISNLKAAGQHVERDQWNWGSAQDEARSRRQAERADVIFCEWGLANAVWHSRNKPAGKTLVVRIHLQEINPRARKFGPQIDANAVDQFVFVSDNVRRTAIEMFDWPEEKTTVIPNYVLDEEYVFARRSTRRSIHLGMVGIIPQRKRFDRAIDLLEGLLNDRADAKLFIKGPRPETLEYMHAPGRVEELSYYAALYEKIERDPKFAGRVTFQPWGNDVADWYENVDYILSPSDFESFHYALADGVLSGCCPLVWPWEEAKEIYDASWIVADTSAAKDTVKAFQSLSPAGREHELQAKRKLVVDRYGQGVVFPKLRALLTANAPASQDANTAP